MLVRRLTLENFLTQYGEQTVEFPVGEDASLAVVLGPNNSGKSSFVKALHFLLHERFAGCTEETAWQLINLRHREETGANAKAVAKVTATFVSEGQEFEIRRTILARRTGAGTDRFAEPEIVFSRLQQTATGNSFVVDADGAMQRKVGLLCPETLLEAFYFSGEPLDGKLLSGVRDVRESLEEYLSILRWEQAAEAAQELRDHYVGEKQKLARQNRELEGLILEETRIQGEIDSWRRRRVEAGARFTEQKAGAERCQSAILQLGNQTRVREDVQKRDALEKQLKREEAALKQADAEIEGAIGASAGFPFLLPFRNKSEAILQNLHEEGILPADLTTDLVDRVLKRRNCFCGTTHSEKTKAAWQEHLAHALRANVGNDLTKLRTRLNPNAPNSLPNHARDTAETLREAIARREAAVVAVHGLEPEIKKLSARIAESPEAELRRLERERQDCEKGAKEADGRIKDADRELKSKDAARKSNKDKREKLRISPDVQRRMTELERSQGIADALGDLIAKSIAALRKQFHRSLQESMTAMYDGHVTDQTTAKVSPHTLLPSIEQDGRSITNLGGGQSQLLGLTYIASVARLRAALHRQMKALGIRLGNVSEQSFVLDCPFSGMEKHYIKAAIGSLRSAARQVVFLLHGGQWPPARQFIEDHIDVAWGIHFHAPAAKIAKLAEDDCVYSLGNRSYRLATANPTGDTHTYSTVEKIAGGKA
jgi:hypothetical protein